MAAPRFVTFEGLDGSGKSSHLRRTAAALERGGVGLRVTQQPGGTPVGERIREVFLGGARLDPLTELLLLFADRRHLLAEVVDPALAAGLVVLCDRFTDSTYAYQGAGRGVAEALIGAVDQLATGGRRPDRTVLFDLPPELARERSRSPKRRDAGRAGVNRFDEEELEFYRRVRHCYLEMANLEPERFRVIDSSGERDATARQVAEALSDVLEPAEWEWIEVGS
jgi:dTMP kinase